MKTRTINPADGLIGVYVLVLMTVALVAAQARGLSGPLSADADRPRELVGDQLLIERVSVPSTPGIEGTIRELKVLPSILAESPDLDWLPDDDLIERYADDDF